MRVSIERGYQPAIEKLMSQLETDDPKLAVHHIIGCWISSRGDTVQPSNAPEQSPSSVSVDDFEGLIKW